MAWKKPATITSHPSKKPSEVEVNGRADGRLPIGEARPLHGTTCLGMVRWGFCTIFPWPIPIGSMVLLYMVTWIPSIYPIYVSIYTIHGSYGIYYKYIIWYVIMYQYSSININIRIINTHIWVDFITTSLFFRTLESSLDCGKSSPDGLNSD